MANCIIEKWWRSLGNWDRSQVCETPFNGNTCTYLEFTDNWWDERTDEEKEYLYNQFFEEV